MGKRGRACVVVLGDIGRSPRMQYHALSLARQASLEVDIVAYGGSEPHSAVIENESIHIHTMPIIQFIMLIWFLCFKVPPPDAFIVQNPPSVPTLVAVKWVSSLRKSAFIVDWHNFGYTLLGIGADGQNETLFTTQVGSDVLLKPNRPALVVSSTSWTPDEDFGILLEAAVMYDRRVAALLDENDSTDEGVFWQEISCGKQYLYPRLLFIITGKGPEKGKYEEKIKRLNLKCVAFRTMWLSAEDYPLLLGSADLGVCLHTSSSGLDLPMKVVDMFGCGLPVCAVSYSCIEELVKVEKNGLLFSSSSELADELFMLFRGFPDECDSLKSLKNGALETGSSARWATEWEEHAKPLISEVIPTNLK
ncbi:Chitobiosyldiphosphodolichol beta-mannosyltransferase [Hibiscus syriacus]|uniref:Chitobiosyldiphosphodolichol beta-mannosyltransferase n=1 Tax=Hibiscus syriacus TaxID=106335 RepID=A0A6A2ZTD7_HIBSY|nr:Chitobiosyldiphosphodolichol beta-mannosyltransferase [Hibiscus syriacus]